MSNTIGYNRQPARSRVATPRSSREFGSCSTKKTYSQISGSTRSGPRSIVNQKGIVSGGSAVRASGSLLNDAKSSTKLGNQFSWEHEWYAVAMTSALDPSRPNPIALLGKDLVLWKDMSTGEWRCFEDRCPHRAVPLSEGKVWPDGSLMCSYHGWRFDGEGSCTHVPQASSLEADRRASGSFRACAVVHPVRESHGIVFVWGQGGPDGVKASERSAVPTDALLVAAEERGDELNYVIPLFFRDLPYDYQTLVENVIDPAHVPFSHHKVQGDRDKVKYGDYELKGISDPGKITVENKMMGTHARISFIPPHIVNYSSEAPDNSFSFRIFCVPTQPGQSRILTYAFTNRKLPFIVKLFLRVPLWLNHILFRHKVLDGDNVFLHDQEHRLVEENRKGGKEAASSWRRLFYMPTRADTLVAAFRHWLDTAGGGGPFGPLHLSPAYPPRLSDRRLLLDRYHSHTKQCMHCKRALAWIDRLRAASLVVGVAFSCAFVCRWVVCGSAMNRGVASFGVAGLACLLAWRLLSSLRQLFFFRDYDHQAS